MKVKVRKSNFELLRIISMLMIVFLHVGTFGILKHTDMLNDFNITFFYFFRFLSIVAVNCYVLISGYFLVKSKFELKKLINLIFETSFYSTIIYLVTIIVGIEKFSVINLVTSILPIFFNKYWFLTVYVLLYLISPILNIIIENISKKNYIIMLFTMSLVICIWQFVYPIDNLGVNGGNSIIQFIFLYFIGAYTQIYGALLSFKDKKKYFLFYILGAILSSIIVFFLFESYVTRPFTYNSLINTLMSYFLFLFFKELTINSKYINYLSRYVLGVYLIHNNVFFRTYLWNELVPIDYISNSHLVVIYSLVSAIFIFSLSLLCSYLIKNIFNKINKVWSLSLKFEKVIVYIYTRIINILEQ